LPVEHPVVGDDLSTAGGGDRLDGLLPAGLLDQARFEVASDRVLDDPRSRSMHLLGSWVSQEGKASAHENGNTPAHSSTWGLVLCKRPRVKLNPWFTMASEMADELAKRDGPRWSQLYETAAAQEGHFTTAQAAEAGYYPQLLTKYLKNGRFVRVRRGVYRLVHFPPGDHEDLVVVWLWSDRIGVFSHETALALHQLSDALPAKAHLTVPTSWERRRLSVPARLVLYFDDVSERDRGWHGCVPVTTPARTLLDCAAAKLSPDLVGRALSTGLRRGLITEEDVTLAVEYVGGRLHEPAGRRAGRERVESP
jgi:hypothetical protein